jgi:hypothetical protein
VAREDCGITNVHQEMDIRGWLSDTARSDFGYYLEWVKGTPTFTSLDTG